MLGDEYDDDDDEYEDEDDDQGDFLDEDDVDVMAMMTMMMNYTRGHSKNSVVVTISGQTLIIRKNVDPSKEDI